MTLLELFALMRKHLRLVVALPVVCALVALAFCYIALPNVYTASVSMYVLTKSQGESDSITNSELSASQMLTNDVAKLIKSDRVQNDAAHALQMDNLKGFKTSVDSQTTTRVIGLSVEGKSPADVAVVANQLAKTTDLVAQEVMDVKSINVIDQASEPTSPSGPPRLMYTLVAFLAGLFIAVAIVVIMDMADTRIHNENEASDMLGVPVIGRIPVIRA